MRSSPNGNARLPPVIVQGTPMDEMARRLETNRNNVYKIMHDARKKLEKRLMEYGLTEEYILEIFSKTA